MRRGTAIAGADRSGRARRAGVRLGAGDGDGGDLQGRAIFDNASAVTGEDVKIAGARVGDHREDAQRLTDDIQGRGHPDDRRRGLPALPRRRQLHDRPQSLIGEKFMECNPEPPRRRRSSPRSPRVGRARASTCCPWRTPARVDTDLINNIRGGLYRERLAILLNELGDGARGSRRGPQRRSSAGEPGAAASSTRC